MVEKFQKGDCVVINLKGAKSRNNIRPSKDLVLEVVRYEDDSSLDSYSVRTSIVMCKIINGYAQKISCNWGRNTRHWTDDPIVKKGNIYIDQKFLKPYQGDIEEIGSLWTKEFII